MQNSYINPAHFGTSLHLMTGIVMDRSDPQQRGRCRVRWFGYYSDDIPTENLPWSLVMMPVDSAGMGGVGTAPVGLMNGSFVIGTFLDGSDMQIPIILGTLNMIEGSGNGTINKNGVQDETGVNAPSNVKFTGTGPKWLQIAKSEIGQKEIKGSQHNPRILEYAKENGFGDDETAWCSSFAKWCVKNSGQSVSGVTGLARSWTSASCVEKLSSPLQGCITVLSRPPNPQSGHVGFLDSIQGGRVRLLGGNQSNSVCISGFPMSRVIGFYWPSGASKEGFDFK